MRVGAAGRIRALALKDVADLWRNPGAVVPPVSMALGALVPAFLVVVAAPAASGEALGDSSEFADAARQSVRTIPELAGLDGSALVQACLREARAPAASDPRRTVPCEIGFAAGHRCGPDVAVRGRPRCSRASSVATQSVRTFVKCVHDIAMSRKMRSIRSPWRAALDPAVLNR